MLQIKMKLLGLFKTIFLPLYTAASMWFMNVIKKCWFAYFAPHPRIFYSCRDLTSGRSSVTNFDLSTVVKAVAVRDLYLIMWYGTLGFFFKVIFERSMTFPFIARCLVEEQSLPISMLNVSGLMLHQNQELKQGPPCYKATFFTTRLLQEVSECN